MTDGSELTAADREKLVRARSKLLLLHPFFGYLVSHLEDRASTNDRAVPTAGTDGAVIHWNLGFLRKLTPDDTLFILAHEAMHCALMHLWRRQGRDETRWSIACDATVNDLLVDGGLRCSMPLIRGAKGRNAEAVFEDIGGVMKANQGREPIDDHGPWRDATTGEPASRQRVDAWRAALQQARTFGRAPGNLGREIDDLVESRRDWRDLLREGLTFSEDYRWTPTDKRFSSVLLPTLTGEVHRVVVAIDTSASIQGERLAAFWSELLSILRNNRCEARILTCDTRIHDEFDDQSFDPAAVSKLGGGGGTSFVPVFERVSEYVSAGWIPEAVVYLTDLDGTFPSDAIGVRTLWIVRAEDAGKPVPFGDVIALDA